MTDWLLISCIASFGVAAGLAFILGSCRVAGRAGDQAEAERAARLGDQHPCPWDLK